MYQFLTALHGVAAVLASFHLLLRYRSARAGVAWLYSFWLLPGLGVAVYVLFAAYPVPRAIRRRLSRAQAYRGAARPATVEGAAYPAGIFDAPFHRLADAIAAFPLARGNAVDILPCGDAAFDAMLEAAAAARREVCLATYILHAGAVADRLREVLAERAAAGVEVRLLYDHLGSIALPRRTLRSFLRAGIRVAPWLRPNPLKGRFQLNYRNHRKILVVDGSVAFTGGQNWSDEYSERHHDRRLRLDLHVRLRGPAVAEVHRVFEEDWALAAEEEPRPVTAPPEAGSLAVRVLPHGPDEEISRLPPLLATALAQARDEVLLVTPYFAPGGLMREALRIAALRGAKVTLLMPGRSDNLLADMAARHSFPALLDAGVEVLLSRGPFLHAKAMVVDGCWATVGSANYDQRSFLSNFELNLEVADPAFAEGVKRHFAATVAGAERVMPEIFRSRSVWSRALASAANLLEPVL